MKKKIIALSKKLAYRPGNSQPVEMLQSGALFTLPGSVYIYRLTKHDYNKKRSYAENCRHGVPASVPFGTLIFELLNR